MADKYKDFEDLAKSEKENVDFQIQCRHLGSEIAIIAPHGGGIEPGTSEIAKAVSAEDLSFYAFEGIKTTGNKILHITSTRFDEPRCLALVESTLRVITIHGDDSQSESVYVGGLDTATVERIISSLLARGFSAERHPKPHKRGESLSNICNKGRDRIGVQIEIAEGLRKTFFPSLKRKDRTKPTQKFGAFVNALREALIRP